MQGQPKKHRQTCLLSKPQKNLQKSGRLDNEMEREIIIQHKQRFKRHTRAFGAGRYSYSGEAWAGQCCDAVAGTRT
jgi:hypothetical protein